tara:strand:- start:25898 stop:27079 length:1182 start_codon:yes stop_codon:yes gene_type:complete
MKFRKIFSFLAVFFILLNLIAYFIIYFKTETSVYGKNYLKKKKSFFISSSVLSYVHPYFGSIDLNNQNYDKNLISNEKLFYNIFESTNSSYNETLKILMLGSSQAINFSNNKKNAYDLENISTNSESENILAKKISSYFPDKKIIFYNAAIKSSKQPQQLFKLYYLSLIGMKFDIVINYDGPLELVHPYLKNVPIKDELIYPRRYSDEIAGMVSDKSCIKNNNKESVSNSYIPIVELISYIQIRNCHRTVSKREGDKVSWKKLVKVEDKNLEESMETSYEIWKKSSFEIENFSKFKNFFYLHVVAPSQYVKGSKNFSDEEKKNYLEYEYGPILSKYYEKLINFKNLDLKDSLDLKYIFKNEKKTVYRDACCRLNDYGLNLVSEKIAKYLKNNY